MYFIRVSWKYIANVEMEAEAGKVGGVRKGLLTSPNPSHTSGLPSRLHNKERGPGEWALSV